MNELSYTRRRLLPGKASDYISSIDEIQPGDLVYLWCRVSKSQNAPHLQQMLQRLQAAVAERGSKVVGHVCHVVLGYDPDENQPRGSTASSWSWAIAQATNEALKLGATKMLAESTDRFRRHPGYGKGWPSAQARTPDLEDLKMWTEGIELITLVPPDATPAEVKSVQVLRGQAKSQAAKGGRKPSKPGHIKDRRTKLLPRVLELKAAGASLRAIQRETDVAVETIRRWLKKRVN